MSRCLKSAPVLKWEWLTDCWFCHLHRGHSHQISTNHICWPGKVSLIQPFWWYHSHLTSVDIFSYHGLHLCAILPPQCWNALLEAPVSRYGAGYNFFSCFIAELHRKRAACQHHWLQVCVSVQTRSNSLHIDTASFAVFLYYGLLLFDTHLPQHLNASIKATVCRYGAEYDLFWCLITEWCGWMLEYNKNPWPGMCVSQWGVLKLTHGIWKLLSSHTQSHPDTPNVSLSLRWQSASNWLVIPIIACQSEAP